MAKSQQPVVMDKLSSSEWTLARKMNIEKILDYMLNHSRCNSQHKGGDLYDHLTTQNMFIIKMNRIFKFFLVLYGSLCHYGKLSSDTSYEYIYKYCHPNLLLVHQTDNY